MTKLLDRLRRWRREDWVTPADSKITPALFLRENAEVNNRKQQPVTIIPLPYLRERPRLLYRSFSLLGGGQGLQDWGFHFSNTAAVVLSVYVCFWGVVLLLDP